LIRLVQASKEERGNFFELRGQVLGHLGLEPAQDERTQAPPEPRLHGFVLVARDGLPTPK